MSPNEGGMSQIRRISTLSEVNVRFHWEQMIVLKMLSSQVAPKFGERFGFVQVEPDVVEGRLGWQALGGELATGQRTVHLERCIGSPHFLSVGALGETQDAYDALAAVWREFVQLNEKGGASTPGTPPQVEEAGILLRNTTAVVHLPHSFDELVPTAGLLRRFVSESIIGEVVDLPRPDASLSLRIPFRVDGRLISGNLRLEPRADTRLKDRIYFTESPLDSTAHFAMLDALCEAVKS